MIGESDWTPIAVHIEDFVTRVNRFAEMQGKQIKVCGIAPAALVKVAVANISKAI
jgi:hypothetical protein